MSILSRKEPQPFVLIDLEVNNFKNFAEQVHSWEVDFLQLDGKTFYSYLQQIIFPEVEIGHTYFNCHLDQKGTSPDDMWTFVIMGEDSSMFKFNHIDTLSTSTMVIYAPGEKINAVTYDGFHIYTFSIKDTLFKKLTQELELNHIEEKLFQIDRVELDPQQAFTLRNHLKYILLDLTTSPHTVISSEGNKLLLRYIPIRFFKEIGKQIGCAQNRVMQDRDLLFMEIRTYMHTHLHEQFTIEQLAKRFKVSERSIRNYFKEELHISPKQYLITLRLHKIHDTLQRASVKKGLIEQTARRFGFFHMGQFSKSYKDFFGELPSETLCKSYIE